jgi:hypothetical protein
MARRMIDDSIWSNERFAEMPMGARLLQLGIINHADDQGRMKANPVYLRNQIFPYDEDVTPAQIQQWLTLMADNDTIILYESERRQYVQLKNWWKYQSLQYAQPSPYPRPDGWCDKIRRTLTKGVIVTCNWTKVNGDPIDDTCDQDGRPLPRNRTPPPPPRIDNTPVDTEENTDDSGEYSGESLGEDTIELNLTKLNITKRESTRAGEPASNGAVASPSSTNGEYLPGLPDPRAKTSQRTRVVEYGMEAKKLGVDAPAFRLLVDALLDGFGKKPLADAGDERTLNYAQELAILIMGVSEQFRTPDGIAAIFKSWRDNDWRGDSLPTSEQLKEHASLMASGKVTCTRKDKPPPPAKPTKLNYKSWLLRTYNADNPTFIGVPKAELEKGYNDYVKQFQLQH